MNSLINRWANLEYLVVFSQDPVSQLSHVGAGLAGMKLIFGTLENKSTWVSHLPSLTANVLLL